MGKKLEIAGQTFGRLTAIKPTGRKGTSGQIYWLFQCDCGNKTEITALDVKRKHIQSCGCLVQIRNVTHGMANTSTYHRWVNMLGRCRNPKNTSYKYYGGRGIRVCERWQKFENFYEDMGEAPNNLTIERINNDGNYEPTNCKWGTYAEQSRNNRNAKLTVPIVLLIRKLLLESQLLHREIADIFNVNKGTIGEINRNETWKDIVYVSPIS